MSMKLILLHILILFSLQLSATNYYIAKSGNNTNSGTTSALAWKTFSPLGAVTLHSGDTVFIHSGDTIRGQMNMVQSGTAANPIVVTSYGIGKGIISGAEVVTNWNQVGPTTLYQATFFGSLKNLFINHHEQTLARYPNEHQYLQLDSAQLSYIKDAALTSLPSNYFTNSKVCVHTAQWCWEKSGVQNVVGDKLTYTVPLTIAAISKFGYFLYDNANLLDTIGEWYYNASGGVMNYFSSTTFNPNTAYCEVSEYSNGINFIGSQSNVVISNLVFDKQTNAGVQIGTGCKNVIINNCEFYRQYNYGVQAKGKYHTVSNCIFSEVDGHGVDVGATAMQIHHNIFKLIGQYRNSGIGGQTNHSAIAINFADSNYIHHNIIDSTGYCGVSSDGASNLIERNIASHCMLLNNDGAPYKTYGSPSTHEIFRNNFALQTYGNTEGTFNGQFKTPAFYFDNYTNFCSLENNTAYDVPGTGIFLNAASHDNFIKDNVIYGGDFGININGSQQMPAPITGGEVKRNTFFALQNNDVCLREVDYTSAFNFGIIDSNYLWQPFDVNHVTLRYMGLTPNFYSLSGWQNASSSDLHSSGAWINLGTSSFTSVLLMNQTDNISTIALGDTLFFDLDSNAVCGSIQLQPYTSKVLINTHNYVVCSNGIKQFNNNLQLAIYPNPVGGQLSVVGSQLSENANTIQVLDLMGRKTIEQAINKSSTQQINTSAIPSGIYFIKVGNQTAKFIKQ